MAPASLILDVLGANENIAGQKSSSGTLCADLGQLAIMLIAIHDPNWEGQSRLLAIRANTHGFENIVSGVFTPVLAKHTKSFNLVDALSVGVDRIQRNFEPMQRVHSWSRTRH